VLNDHKKEVTIHTLTHLRWIGLVSVRSSYRPFKTHEVGFRAFKVSLALTHYRPAMPFGNRKKYFRGSFQFSIVTV